MLRLFVYYTQITDVSDSVQIMKLSFYLTLSWEDKRINSWGKKEVVFAWQMSLL
jgi:hypothetical protein